MSETTQAYQWITSTLRGDVSLMATATGGVWQGFADIGTQPPYVLFTQQAGTDVLTLNAVRLFDHLLMQIKAVGPVSNYAALVTIAGRIDALFKEVRNIGLSGGGAVLACYREQSLMYGELVNGKAWQNLGGLYHVELQGS